MNSTTRFALLRMAKHRLLSSRNSITIAVLSTFLVTRERGEKLENKSLAQMEEKCWRLSSLHAEQGKKIENKSLAQMEENITTSSFYTISLLPQILLGALSSSTFTACDTRTVKNLEQTSTKNKLRSMYDVKWETPLGEGGFGAVFLGKEKKTGELLSR